MNKPLKKPTNPNFSSGPTAKRANYNLNGLNQDILGRSHRSVLGKSRLKKAIEQSKKILNIPADYLVGIVPASDTGAMEMAMWNLLGPKKVEVIYFENFGNNWYKDIKNQLKLNPIAHSADYGYLPNLNQVNFANDIVFTWNGTTSGVKIPNGNWIPADREGLTICDATSAVFGMDIPWEKIDVLTYSWQKVLGGEAAHGMLILSPRAVNRINSYNPTWPIPKIMQLKKDGILNESIFKGNVINTPSMLCVEDYLSALNWAEKIGGLTKLIEKSQNNLQIWEKFVATHNWIHFLCSDSQCRSNTSVCFSLDLNKEEIQKIVKLLEDEKVAYDCNSYKSAPAGLRFWSGPTVEAENITIVCEWLEWAYQEIKK